MLINKRYTVSLMENKKELLLAGLFILLAAIGTGGYFFWQQKDTNKELSFVTSSESTTETSDIVKNFSQAIQPQPVLGQATSEVEPPTSSSPVASSAEDLSSPVSEKPYNLQLTSGWKKKSKSADKSCVAGSKAVVDTYTRDSQTIIVYENTHPGGCDLSGVADVYLDYDFTETGDGIVVDTSKIKQCSKEENRDCPKGDGRVSVYIGNKESSDAKNLAANKITKKTYFFSITDTAVQPDFEKQARSLSKLIEKISF
jgi:hypothetical protein